MAQITLTLKDAGGNALGQYHLDGAGSAQHIQAIDGAYYQFTDAATGLGPESLITDRVGNDLLVSFDRGQGAGLVIENYFSQGQGALVGVQANGGLFNYPVASAPEHVLAEELAAAATPSTDTPTTVAPLAVLGGLALIGGGIALANHDNDKGSTSGMGSLPELPPFKPAPQPESPPNPINPTPQPLPTPQPNPPGQNPASGTGGLLPPYTPNPNPSTPPGTNPTPKDPHNPGLPDSDPRSYKPYLQDDIVQGKRHKTVTIKVTENDKDPQDDIDPNTLKLLDKDGNAVDKVVVEKQGTWTVNPGGHVTFKPQEDFDKGNPDPVEYILRDRNGNPSLNKAKISISYDEEDAANQAGEIEIHGEASVGKTLTAVLSDGDGYNAGEVKYQWLREGKKIAGATTNHYQLTATDIGKKISVRASYEDGAEHSERPVSKETEAVKDGSVQPPTKPNHEPTGSVTISGEAKVGQTLTASNDLKDEDGLGTITYRWFAGGKEVGQGATYQLTANDKGKTITVKAEYTDGKGTAESVESAKTAEVADSGQTPPPPATNHEGTVAITGESKVGGTLTATVSDDDQFDAAQVAYQWLRDGKPIDGVTASTYKLVADDAGHKISVRATYYDNAHHHETPASVETEIARPQTPPPTGNGMTVSDASAVIEGNALVYTVKLANPAKAGQVLKLTADYHDSAVAADQLAKTADPFQPGEYLGNGTVFTRSVADMPLAANSAEITAYAPMMAKNAYGVTTGLNTSAYNIPIYIVDSSDPKQHYANITSHDDRITASGDISAHTLGRIPLPDYAQPAGGGDASFAVYDRATGLMREYFHAVKTADGWDVSAAGYFQGEPGMGGLGAKNFWMQHTHGGSAVVGMLNPLSQIGVSEVLAGSINHAVSVTLPNAKKGVTSFPAQQNDGADDNPNAPAEGQWFRIKPGVDLDNYRRPDGSPLSPMTKMIAKAAQTYGGYGADKNLNNFAFNAEAPNNYLARGKENPWRDGGEIAKKLGMNSPANIDDFPWELTEWAPVGWNDKGHDAGVYAARDLSASINGVAQNLHNGEITLPEGASEIQIKVPTLTHNNLIQTDDVTLHAQLLDNGSVIASGDGSGHVNDAPSEIHDTIHGGGVLVSPNINPDDYAQLVQLEGQALLDYVKAHGHDILQKPATETPGVTLRGSDGDDTLISGYGVDFLEGGKGADTFIYAMDGENSFPYQNNDHILDFNPAEGDRIVLTRGEGWTLQFDRVEFEAAAHVQRLQYKVYKGSEGYINAIQIHSHDGHAFSVDEIMNAITVL